LSKGLIALIAVLTIASLAAGCGGDDETATASLTKAEFVKRADAICDKGNERFQTLYEKYVRAHENDAPEIEPGGKRTLAQSTEITERALAPVVKQEVDEIRALGAPSGDGRRVAEILDAIEDGLKKVEEDPTVVGNTEEEFSKPHELATEYGLEVCGR
jgi:hypothetical protein